MKKVFKGSAFKKWFLGSDVRRVLLPATGNRYHICSSLDEIDDDKVYLMVSFHPAEVIVEEVELIINS